MRTATGLALVAIGAILAFAVTTSPSFLNLQVAGWILILTGVAGLFVPRRGYGWLRRRVVVRRPRGGAAAANGEPRRFKDGRWFRQNAIPDPRLPQQVELGRGRGLFFMRRFADDVHFDFPPEGGCLVSLRKRLR